MYPQIEFTFTFIPLFLNAEANLQEDTVYGSAEKLLRNEY